MTRPTPIGRAALRRAPMSPDEIANLVERVRALDARPASRDGRGRFVEGGGWARKRRRR